MWSSLYSTRLQRGSSKDWCIWKDRPGTAGECIKQARTRNQTVEALRPSRAVRGQSEVYPRNALAVAVPKELKSNNYRWLQPAGAAGGGGASSPVSMTLTSSDQRTSKYSPSS